MPLHSEKISKPFQTKVIADSKLVDPARAVFVKMNLMAASPQNLEILGKLSSSNLDLPGIDGKWRKTK
jgi:hypothetical protein